MRTLKTQRNSLSKLSWLIGCCLSSLSNSSSAAVARKPFSWWFWQQHRNQRWIYIINLWPSTLQVHNSISHTQRDQTVWGTENEVQLDSQGVETRGEITNICRALGDIHATSLCLLLGPWVMWVFEALFFNPKESNGKRVVLECQKPVLKT